MIVRSDVFLVDRIIG